MEYNLSTYTLALGDDNGVYEPMSTVLFKHAHVSVISIEYQSPEVRSRVQYTSSMTTKKRLDGSRQHRD
jgi:hypothetical protein